MPITQGHDSEGSPHRAACSRSANEAFEGDRYLVHPGVLRQICHLTRLGLIPSRDEEHALNELIGDDGGESLADVLGKIALSLAP